MHMHHTCLKRRFPWRGKIMKKILEADSYDIQGNIHDPNAWSMMVRKFNPYNDLLSFITNDNYLGTI